MIGVESISMNTVRVKVWRAREEGKRGTCKQCTKEAHNAFY